MQSMTPIVSGQAASGLVEQLRAVARPATRSSAGLLVLRSVVETVAVSLFVICLANMPIADITALGQLAPMMMLLGLALFFREKLALNRLLLIAVGFAGAVLVAAGYLLSWFDSEWLGLSLVGYIVNWFGDSLDGTLANEDIEKLVNGGLDASLRLTIPLTFLILLIAFGAVVAAVVPLVLAITALLAAFGILGLYSQAVAPVSPYAGQLIVLIGLAVAVDYSLFMITRYRTERRHGRESYDAIRVASATAGRAVFFSGLAVMISLAGLITLGVSLFTSMSTPSFAPAWMYEPTTPSRACRFARFDADASPFFRRKSTAFSRSSPEAASASLQSITPAPVLSRSSRTFSAVVAMIPEILLSPKPNGRRGAVGRGSGRAVPRAAPARPEPRCSRRLARRRWAVSPRRLPPRRRRTRPARNPRSTPRPHRSSWRRRRVPRRPRPRSSR